MFGFCHRTEFDAHRKKWSNMFLNKQTYMFEVACYMRNCIAQADNGVTKCILSLIRNKGV